MTPSTDVFAFVRHRLRKPVLLPIAIMAAALVLTTTGFAADNDALIKILVKKGILTKAEAEEVQAELDEQAAESAASKLKIAEQVTELKIGGDTRLRYEYQNRDGQVDPAPGGSDEDRSPAGAQASRWRFRLRLNADFKLAGGFFGGVGLETNQASDSGNQTFQDGFDDYNIYISKVFLGWDATDWLTLVMGKQPNPFYTTDLVWDADINPTGLSERVKIHKFFSQPAEEGLSKDGKTVVASKPAESPWELTLTLGQFIFEDNDENAFDNDASTDAYLFVGQLVGSYKVAKDLKVTFAPGYMTYIHGDTAGLRNNNAFTDTDFSGETRNLSILTAPGDISFKVAGLKTKFYWDFAYNLEGEDRATEVYGLIGNYRDTDSIAWLAGLQIGDTKAAGDWSLFGNYRSTGIAAVDPNLNDSDFAAGELNTQGIRTGVTYNFTSWLLGAVTYSHAWNVRENLIGGRATADGSTADVNAVDILQVDVNWKF
jgi:polyhydroxyalkanoate synthesis regulator phasin